MTTLVELYHAPNCPRCTRAMAVLREQTATFGDRLDYRERDVIAALDDAVRLGIRATPAIVINDRLVFTGLPAHEKLQAALQAAVRGAST